MLQLAISNLKDVDPQRRESHDVGEWRVDCSVSPAMNAAESQMIVSTVIDGLRLALSPPTPTEAEVLKKLPTNAGAYSLALWLELVDAAATSRFGDLLEQDRYAEVGRLFMRGFAETTPGGATLSLMRVVGPDRAMRRMSRNLREATDFVNVEIEPLPPNGLRLRFNEVSRAGFYVGVLEAVLIAADAVYPVVTISAREGRAVTFDVRWTP